MAKANKNKNSALLSAAIEVLEDASDTGCEGMVTIGNDAYLKLKVAVRDIAGIDHGIDIEEIEDLGSN